MYSKDLSTKVRLKLVLHDQRKQRRRAVLFHFVQKVEKQQQQPQCVSQGG